MRVPFVDLKAQYQSIKNEIDHSLQSVLESSAFISGPYVQEFEENFSQVHETKYCVATNSGTSALHSALWALKISQGDEVIVPTFTFFATPEAVSLAGATPVFIDCEKNSFQMDPNLVEAAISKKTKAIIAVHLYGQSSNLTELLQLCKKHGLFLIEDCAQAHLCEYKGKKVGSFGDCGCFSFYPGKNLGAYGEAGAVITNKTSLYKRLLSFRDHGSFKKYYHNHPGHNYRMDGFQGAILNKKLKYLPEWTKKRQEHAQTYIRKLNSIPWIELPKQSPDSQHVYHQFVIKAQQRDLLSDFLQRSGIDTHIHYPIPCHRQKAYKDLPSNKCKLLLSEALAKAVLSLPIFPEISLEQITYVTEKIQEFYAQQKSRL